MKWEPKDVVAAIVVSGTLVLMAMGINNVVTIIFAAVVAAYIGIDYTTVRRKK